jgi:hypothetical protein
MAEAIGAWRKLEVLSVAASFRSCAIISVSDATLPAAVRYCLGANLIAVPVATGDMMSPPGGSTSLRPGIGGRAAPCSIPTLRLAIGLPSNVRQFLTAYDRGDHETLGSLLGIPGCCVEVYRQVATEKRSLDSTWTVAQRSSHVPSSDGLELTVKGWRETNILWRQAGVHAVPHQVCSFDCAESAAFGRRLLDLGRINGLRRAVDAIEQILAWEVEWSGLDGIANLRTPIGQLVTSTDTIERRVVRRLGIESASQGKVPRARGLSNSRTSDPSRKDGVTAAKDQYAAQNGFFTVEGMERAHRPIAKYVDNLLNTQNSSTVVDLGCGNGALLRAICSLRAGVIPLGMEIDAECAARAQRYLGEFSGTVFPGDMLQQSQIWDEPVLYDVVLLMVCRLLEVSDAQASRLIERIFSHARHLVVYAYDDEFIRHHGTLGDLARRSGLRLLGWDERSFVCEATIAKDRADIAGKR